MKTAGILKLAALVSFLMMTACVETTTPLCDSSNKVDVPGLEGQHTASFMAAADQELQEQEFNIERVGKGEYSMEGNVASTCRLGDWTVVESPTKYGTYQQSVISVGEDGVVSMNQMILSQEALRQAGVKFQIVEREIEETTQTFKSMALGAWNGETQKFLVIDTEGLAAKKSVSHLAKPSAIGMSFH